MITGLRAIDENGRQIPGVPCFSLLRFSRWWTLEHQNSRQPGARYDHLFDVELIPVFSSRLMKGPPPIREPEDLLRHVLLHGLNRLPDWKLWLDANRLKVPVDARSLRFGNSHLVYQAAANGIGVAIAQPRFVEDDIAAGRLIAPFPKRVKTAEIYYLVSLPSKISSPLVSAFRDWLLSEARRPMLTSVSSESGRV